MATPSTEVVRFRDAATKFIEDMRDIDRVLAIVEDHGADDAARQAFFTAEFGVGTNNPDLTWATFANGVIALRAIRTARDAQKLALAKLLR